MQFPSRFHALVLSNSLTAHGIRHTPPVLLRSGLNRIVLTETRERIFVGDYLEGYPDIPTPTWFLVHLYPSPRSFTWEARQLFLHEGKKYPLGSFLMMRFVLSPSRTHSSAVRKA